MLSVNFFFFFNVLSFLPFFLPGGRVLPCSPGWPQTPNHLALASQATVTGMYHHIRLPTPTLPTPCLKTIFKEENMLPHLVPVTLVPSAPWGEITGPHANYSSQATTQLPPFPCASRPYTPNSMNMAESPRQVK